MDVSNLTVGQYGFIHEPDERDSHGNLISWPGQRRPVRIRVIEEATKTLLVKILGLGGWAWRIDAGDFTPDPLFDDGTVQDW